MAQTTKVKVEAWEGGFCMFNNPPKILPSADWDSFPARAVHFFLSFSCILAFYNNNSNNNNKKMIKKLYNLQSRRTKYWLYKELSCQSPCPLSRQGQWCLQWFYDVQGCVVRTWTHASTWWLSAAVSSSTCTRSTTWSCCGVSQTFLWSKRQTSCRRCSCYSHTACGRNNEWWKWSMFNFSYSLVISSFLLHLIPAIALCQRGVVVDWRKRIKYPYIKKCTLLVAPTPETLSCNITSCTILPVCCSMNQVFVSNWL